MPAALSPVGASTAINRFMGQGRIGRGCAINGDTRRQGPSDEYPESLRISDKIFNRIEAPPAANKRPSQR